MTSCAQQPLWFSSHMPCLASSFPAGVASKQELQDSFKVSHLHSEGSGHLVVSVERDIIDMPTVAMAAQAAQAAQGGAGAVPAGAARDPGAAVAMGHPMMLRMWVPLWVINGTGLPITAGALQLLSTACMLTAGDRLTQCLLVMPHSCAICGASGPWGRWAVSSCEQACAALLPICLATTAITYTATTNTSTNTSHLLQAS
jgi:hypothetical protein